MQRRRRVRPLLPLLWARPCHGCEDPNPHTYHLTRLGRLYFSKYNLTWGR